MDQHCLTELSVPTCVVLKSHEVLARNRRGRGRVMNGVRRLQLVKFSHNHDAIRLPLQGSQVLG